MGHRNTAMERQWMGSGVTAAQAAMIAQLVEALGEYRDGDRGEAARVLDAEAEARPRHRPFGPVAEPEDDV